MKYAIRAAILLTVILALAACPPFFPFGGDQTEDDPADDDTVDGDDPVALSAPLNVTASEGVYKDQIEIGWDPVPQASYYFIYRSQSVSSAGSAIGWVDAAYTDTYNSVDSPSASPITPGVHYFYRVAAADADESVGTLSAAAEGWAFESAVPNDFVATYSYDSGSSISSSTCSVVIDDTPTMTRRSYSYLELVDEQIDEFEVSDLDLEAFYQLLQDRNIYRIWLTPSRTPTGSASERVAFTDSGTEWAIPPYISDDNTQAEDKQAVIDAIEALLPAELAESFPQL